MTEEDNAIWQGALKFSTSSSLISDISLRSRSSSWHPNIPKGDMDVLAFIQPSLVPWHLVTGPPLHVVTKNESTQDWFSDVLLYESLFSEHVDSTRPLWFESSIMQSRVGILARPTGDNSKSPEVRATEVLFYAERSAASSFNRLPTPPTSSQHAESQEQVPNEGPPEPDEEISVRALLISSDLQHTHLTDAPADKACFLPSAVATRQAAAAEMSKKRLGMIFDEASARRKRARYGSGQSISMAASRTSSFDQQTESLTNSVVPEPTILQPRRVEKDAASTKPAAAPRPGSRKQSSHGVRPSTANSAHVVAPGEEAPMSQRNKEAVSRIVMAGMRIHGLTQSKGQGKSKPSPAGLEGDTEDRDKEAEYKGIYHQTYRGALFAFRRDVDKHLLPSGAVGDVVDKLLAIFCHEPP